MVFYLDYKYKEVFSMNIVLLGPPGSGKGTQGERIESKYNFRKLSTGDMLRHAIEENSKIGLKASKIMSEGGLVNDQLINELVAEVLLKSFNNNEQGIILDGYPRTINQAKFLDSFLEDNQKQISHVISFNVDNSLLIDRVSNRFFCVSCGANYNRKFNPPKQDGICDHCGSENFSQRNDDNADVMQSRLEAYDLQTAPVISYYQEKGQLKCLNGDQEIEKISNDIDLILKK